MKPVLQWLKERVVGSPLSTFGGVAVGAIQLGIHEAFAKVDWTDLRTQWVSVLTAAIPVVWGALMKAVPKDLPLEAQLAQKIGDAMRDHVQQLAGVATDKAIAEIKSIVGDKEVVG